jgi:isopentenyldiphosphate isomerase
MKDETDVTIQDTEVSAYRWVDYNKAMELITYKDSKSILNEAMNFLSQSLRL